ncbi:MAG: hypothetical protein COA96_09135 [SAR86 cluster bacterium]|uniref:Anti sigma-E protein RseA N-terminal domain-containing protein n=1 Tax=SAR86 cluster bacterium TaxID=2030880 RepID=A0A2A5AZ79_9GAMM|nr:MAG: hypothetical protein COA96_09135 [SAR86 cluster bacterium]
MSEIDKESLSALLDNEADDLELRRLLKACEQDTQLLETWERYSLVQSVLHDRGIPVSSNLSQKIAAQIEEEKALISNVSANDDSSWRQSVGKIAIAASVAFIFMFAVQTSLTPEPISSSAVAANNGNTPNADQQVTQATTILAQNTVNEVDPVARQRLREYIESMTFDEQEPPRMEHIQDSPLYRLVNEQRARF